MGLLCVNTTVCVLCAAANSLDANSSGDEYGALDLVHVEARRRPDEATTNAHIDLLSLDFLG
jgi:hypothetical protein